MTTSPIWISKRSPAPPMGRWPLPYPTSITAAARAQRLIQAFPSSPEAGFVFNTFGGYVADDWKVSDRLTVSLNLRLEHYANPVCATDCFSRLVAAFTGTPDPNAASTPYNQLIVSGQQNAYPKTQAIVWEPRLGIAWRPFHSDKTVIRTGAGIFADELAGGLAEEAAFNVPGAQWVRNWKRRPGAGRAGEFVYDRGAGQSGSARTVPVRRKPPVDIPVGPRFQASQRYFVPQRFQPACLLQVEL